LSQPQIIYTEKEQNSSVLFRFLDNSTNKLGLQTNYQHLPTVGVSSQTPFVDAPLCVVRIAVLTTSSATAEITRDTRVRANSLSL